MGVEHGQNPNCCRLGVLVLISAVYLVLSRKEVKYKLPIEEKPAIQEKPPEKPTKNITQENITPEEYMEELLANMTENETADFLIE